MLLQNQIEFSYFSLQLLEYLIHNHPHRAHDYYFIKLRGDEAAEAFEKTLSEGFPQETALEDAYEELYKGLHFSLHALIKDILWDEFSNAIPVNMVENAARVLLPKVCHILPPYIAKDEDWGNFKDAELEEIDEDELRSCVIAEIKRIRDLK